MAKNDCLLLDGILDDRISIRLPSEKRDECFEHLAFEQILKDFDLSTDEIIQGTIDGRQDGGIDGFFIFVNGHLLQDPESFVWPRTNSELAIFLFTSKHHNTFKQGTIDAMIASLSEILDLSLDSKDLKGAYSESLVRMRNNLKLAYRKLSPRLANFSIEVVYTSRGDTCDIGTEVSCRANQVVQLIKENFGSCESRFRFVGSTELVDLHRRMPNYTLELPFVEALSKGERYIVLSRLSDYYKFISNDDGNLRRHLFDSNVRDFMGLNRVNEDIKNTLSNNESPDFWWLNNGVTILATSAAITGKSIQASDIQIVNGLQTTESIFRHFHNNPDPLDERCVLVKLIVTKDEAIRDLIIQATNNQTDVEIASLHATDKIQRDIEDVMLRNGLFYERRKNFYANQGRRPFEMVTPLYVAAGYVALVLKRPYDASGLRSRFMRTPSTYEAVFNVSQPLEIWPKIASILKKVDTELEKVRPQARVTDRFLKGWRYVTAFLIISDHYKRFMFSTDDLLRFDPELIGKESIEAVWLILSETISENPNIRKWQSRKHVFQACTKLAEKKNITDIKGLGLIPQLPPNYPTQPGQFPPISAEFIDDVKKLIPPQPWKPGMHRVIIEALKCAQSSYSAVVDQLIEEGTFFRQKDGVLYDTDGNVVGFDSERVNPETLELVR